VGIKNLVEINDEQNILQFFFEAVKAISQLDSSVSDSKLISVTQHQLRTALRYSEQRCTCAKRSYGPCEVCQESDSTLVTLRNFFRVIRNAKKHGMVPIEMKEFVENTSEWLETKSR
jgi:hypothetical protein